MRTFWSLSVTITIFAPPSRHFLVQASALALAPLAPHLLSDTHPLTVELFPMSSKASADRASTKQTARQISSSFFMTLHSPLELRLRPYTAGIMEHWDSATVSSGNPFVVVK